MNEASENIKLVLKGSVTTLLVTEHEFLIEDAEAAVEESMVKDQGMWNVNAEAKDIANYLASDDDDE